LLFVDRQMKRRRRQQKMLAPTSLLEKKNYICAGEVGML